MHTIAYVLFGWGVFQICLSQVMVSLHKSTVKIEATALDVAFIVAGVAAKYLAG